MEFLYKKSITPQVLSQLYRLVEMEYLINGMPVSNIFTHTDISTYQTFSIVGFITEVQMQIVDQTSYFCHYLKCTIQNFQKIYKIYVPTSFYKEYFILAMNPILKRKTQFKLLFTELQIFIKQNQIVFGITKKSSLLTVTLQYVQKQIQPIFQTFKSRFSFIKLQEIFSTTDADYYKENGIPFEELRSKIVASTQSPASRLTIIGVVEIKKISVQSISRKSCKVVWLNLYQSQIRNEARELGVYDVKGFFYGEQEKNILQKLQNGNTVMITNVQRSFQESGKLQYRFNDNCEIKVLDQGRWRYSFNMLKVWKNLCTIQFKDVKSSAIMRNFIKLRVQLVRMRFIKLYFQCKKCRISFKNARCEQCNCDTEFYMWSQCQVEDNSAIAYLSIEGTNLIKFLGLTQSQKSQLDLLINKNTQSKDIAIRRLFYIMNIKRIQKYIIGIPIIDMKKQVGGGYKDNNQQTIGNDKKFRTLNVNGIIDRYERSERMLVKIKAHQVL